jgi:iron complex outermembrane recepter protein
MNLLKFSRCLPALLVIACLLSLKLLAQPAPSGSITGVISNSATRQHLQGAIVEIPELGKRATSDNAGRYKFENVPQGSRTVKVSYTGLDPQSESVVVGSGLPATLDFDLTSEVYELEAFTVTSDREGNAVSITRQRNADNAMNILSMDTYGNVADGNIGNFMQRLPGIGAVIENGDIVGFGVRGTPSEMNAVNVDGTRMSNAYAGFNPQGDRAAIVDSIPSDFIKEIELIKAPTPNLAADSVGGATNMVTKSAFDFKNDVLTYRAGFNMNTFRKDERALKPTGSLSYMTRLGEAGKVGMAFSGSYTETENTRDRLQMQRNFDDGRVTQARTLNDQAVRTRGGAALKFNFRPVDDLELYAGLQYTYFSFRQERTDWNIVSTNTNVADYDRVSRAKIESGSVPKTSTNSNAGVAPGFTDDYTELLHARFGNINGNTFRIGRTYKYSFGGEKKMDGDQKVTFRTSFNPSEYDFDFQFMEARLNGGIGVAIDSSTDRKRPLYIQTYGPSILYGQSLDGYSLTQSRNHEYSEEEVSNAALEYEKRFTANPYDLTFESGADWRQQHRTIEVYKPRWTYVGPDGKSGGADDNLEQFRVNTPGYGLFNNRYPQRDTFSGSTVAALVVSNPELFTENGTTVTDAPSLNEITEDVFSAYAMGRMKFGELGVLAGVRYEKTDVAAEGKLSDPANPGITRASREGSYDKFFPGLHFRYEAIPGLLLRSSVTSSYSRPSFNQLYPVTTVSYNTSTGLGQVSQNNPALKPQTSTNLDFSLEYYFEPVGIVSGSYFEKDINDFIASEISTIGLGADNGFGGEYEGFDLRTNRNFGSATIKGFELNYSQQLRKLPQPFDTLSIFANYTHIETNGNYDGESEELVRFVPETANAGASWRFKNVEIRAAYNFKGGYLNSYNTNPVQRQRTTDIATWDFNFQYRYSPGLNFFLDVVNAFNKWESWYTGNDPSRIIMSEVYGTRISAGISGRF